MPEKQPKGWVKTILGEIAEPSRERALPSEVSDMRYVGLEHIEPQTMRLLGHGYTRDIRSSSVRFSKGDILYGKMRPYLNKVWVAEFDGLCSAEFLVFKQRYELNSQFLALRLNSDDFVSFANGQVSGERPRVDFEKLAGFPVLMPPVAEQKRIVVKLNAALSRVRRAEIASQRAREHLKVYRSGVIQAAVTGELTREWREASMEDIKASPEAGEDLLQHLLALRRVRWEEAEFQRLRANGKQPKNDNWKSRITEPVPPKSGGLPKLPNGWAWTSVDQISWASGYGTSVKCSYEANGPAVLRIPNVRNRTLDFEDLKFAMSSQDFGDEDFVTPGDLLLIRTNGSKDLIGRAAILKTETKQKCSFASYLIRFRLIGDETIWSWVSLAWDSELLRSSIESRAVSTAGQYNLSLSRLADLALPVPPIDERIEIVREVEHRMSAADRLAAAIEQQLARSQVMRQSLLRDAFAGSLVPQDQKDEPATILLARIRSSNKCEVQIRRIKGMQKNKFRTKVARRPLLDILLEHKKPITPEELFREAKFEPSQVDLFYRELSSLRDKLKEQKPTPSEARTWPYGAHVVLELKES